MFLLQCSFIANLAFVWFEWSWIPNLPVTFISVSSLWEQIEELYFFSVILKFFSFISPTDIVDFNELSLSAWKLWVSDLCREITSQWSLPGNYESVISAWKLWVSDLCLEIMSQWYIKCITMFTSRNNNINFEAIVTSLKFVISDSLWY